MPRARLCAAATLSKANFVKGQLCEGPTLLVGKFPRSCICIYLDAHATSLDVAANFVKGQGAAEV